MRLKPAEELPESACGASELPKRNNVDLVIIYNVCNTNVIKIILVVIINKLYKYYRDYCYCCFMAIIVVIVTIIDFIMLLLLILKREMKDNKHLIQLICSLSFCDKIFNLIYSVHARVCARARVSASVRMSKCS